MSSERRGPLNHLQADRRERKMSGAAGAMARVKSVAQANSGAANGVMSIRWRFGEFKSTDAWNKLVPSIQRVLDTSVKQRPGEIQIHPHAGMANPFPPGWV